MEDDITLTLTLPVNLSTNEKYPYNGLVGICISSLSTIPGLGGRIDYKADLSELGKNKDLNTFLYVFIITS